MRAGALGDLLLLRGAIASLRRAGARPWLLAPRCAAAALVGPGEAEGLADWDDPRLAWLWRDAGPPETAADGDSPWPLDAFEAALAYTRDARVAASLRRVIPTVLARSPLPPAGHRAADWYRAAVADLGVPLVEAPPVRPTPDERRAAADTLRTLPRGFLALHPGSGSAAKNWPPECYAALAQMASPGRPWLLVEGPADATACAALRSLPDARLARGLPLRVLGAVLAEAGAYVGNDSGVSHLAAAWGAPTVVLFGPTDPAVWAPIGPRTASVRAPAGNLANLEPGPVFDALLHLGELHAGLMRRRASRRPAG